MNSSKEQRLKQNNVTVNNFLTSSGERNLEYSISVSFVF